LEVAELDVSEVFNPKDWCWGPEPETPGSTGSATEEQMEERREEKECKEGAKLKPVFSFMDHPGKFKF